MTTFEKYADADADVTPIVEIHEFADSQPLDVNNTVLRETARLARGACGLLTELEMAAVLMMSVTTLIRWRQARQGPPYVRIGKRVFYLLSEFQKWLADESKRQDMRQNTNTTRPVDN